VRNFILLVYLVFAVYTLAAQSSSTLMGARAEGLGYTSACLTDEWSLFNNIGGLSAVKNATAAFTYQARPGITAFNSMAAVMAVPLSYGVAGAGIFRFGDNLYNEQILTAGYSSTFGLASLGIKANYIQYNAEGYGRKGIASLSAGGIAKLTPVFSIGAHIININQPKLTDDGERLPTTLIAGIAFTPSEKLLITTEIQKDLEYSAAVKAGLEYQPYKKITFRTGVNVNPGAGYIGIGFKPGKFILDYAFMHATDLGASHQATVSYRLNGKRA